MILAAVDWANLAPVGAFVAGAVLATIATIRITRYLLEYLRKERDDG